MGFGRMLMFLKPAFQDPEPAVLKAKNPETRHPKSPRNRRSTSGTWIFSAQRRPLQKGGFGADERSEFRWGFPSFGGMGSLSETSQHPLNGLNLETLNPHPEYLHHRTLH